MAVAVLFVMTATAADAASTVAVPDLVLHASVPVRVQGAASGSTVTFVVGGVTATGTTTTADDRFLAASVPAGFQSWTVTVVHAGVTETFTGTVNVDTTLDALTASVAALAVQVADLTTAGTAQDAAIAANAAKLTDLATQVEATNVSLSAAIATAAATPALPADFKDVVATAVSGAVKQTNGGLTSRIQGTNATALAASDAAEGARSFALYAALGAVVAALISAITSAFLFLKIQKSHQEVLVFMLALASHSGLTSDSPEFQRAVDALRGPSKPAKEKKPKPEKAKKPKK